MTEDEHKQLWCPHVRYVPFRDDLGFIRSAINRWIARGDQQMNPEPARCIGSACAMWRTGPKQGHGYCGLAGMP